MRITILSPGKVKEPWLKKGIEEYIKRLRRYSKIEIVELTDCPDSWPKEKVLTTEGDRILSKISATDHVVALDLGGLQCGSVEFAHKLRHWLEIGGSKLVFVIGGSHGLSPAVRRRAQASLGLSDLTFTHQMSRLILLEQCYRAFRIQNHEPYHK